MPITTVLRGFKIPIPVLDRFLESNGVYPTEGIPPIYDRVLARPDPNIPTIDPFVALIRSKLTSFSPEAAASFHNQNAHVFIAEHGGLPRAKHAYVAYAYLMVFAQRQLDLARDLPEQAPPGWRELREEMMGFATAEDEGLMNSPGVQATVERQDSATGLFVVSTEERDFPETEHSFRDSDRKCNVCGDDLGGWFNLQGHKKQVHGMSIKRALPEDL
ncbi:uncharacterized protein C8A04DRAFT_16209 [Dichotomopilus funicola]|uniref:C2H2-type domain-containing protein n=1 Tax=Dichotomopilus funicola TaxID=1934379 RepID=A0AAN6UUW9_9PEZI|nr:hypothetical protein C8A04DRAFT_16209 [Dichotomopilus funicola]